MEKRPKLRRVEGKTKLAHFTAGTKGERKRWIQAKDSQRGILAEVGYSKREIRGRGVRLRGSARSIGRRALPRRKKTDRRRYRAKPPLELYQGKGLQGQDDVEKETKDLDWRCEGEGPVFPLLAGGVAGEEHEIQRIMLKREIGGGRLRKKIGGEPAQ